MTLWIIARQKANTNYEFEYWNTEEGWVNNHRRATKFSNSIREQARNLPIDGFWTEF